MVDLVADDTPALKAWRREIRSFLEETLPNGFDWLYDYDEADEGWEAGIKFWQAVGRRGWGGLCWPKAYYGQERSAIEHWILQEEFIDYDVPAYPVIGYAVADGLLRVGTHEQRLKHLKGIAEATVLWGEGYTEPSAGSDLASLRTKAVRDGNEWVISGQKTFGTAAHRCQMMIVLARTDPDAPRHAGITAFLVPLDTKGITMLPLHNIAGGQQNQTFFDEVRVPADAVLGGVNQAWNQIWFRMGGDKLDKSGPHFDSHSFRLAGMMERVLKYCKETKRNGKPLSQDPVIRLKLGEIVMGIETMKAMVRESYTFFSGKADRPFGEAMGHLYQAHYKEFWPRMAQLSMEIVGPLAQVQGGKWSRLNGRLEKFYRTSFGNHAGGTSQLKRMVLATRGLNLPR